MNTLSPRSRATRIVLSVALVLSVLFVAALPAHAQEAAKTPKNIIVMIGDGWGFNHMRATDYYQNGEEGKQVYQQTFTPLAMSTYSVGGSYDPDQIRSTFKAPTQGVTDSAAAATALATGVKTRNGSIGVDPEDKPAENVLDRAETKGKATGVVTTVPLSHATPAGFVAHCDSRAKYVEIAKQMILESSADVVFGGGHPLFDNDAEAVEKADPNGDAFQYVGGKDTWDALTAGTAGADADGDGTPDPWKLVQTRAEFQDLADGTTLKRVVGVCQAAETLQERRTSADGEAADDAPFQTPLNENVPTLAELANGALNVLQQDPDGFFLMIEGGAIDWASHKNQLGRMIEESIAFNNAVEAVVAWVEANSSWDETLVVVTADHECGYLLGEGSDPERKLVVNNGKGKMPGAAWYHKSHTNQLVPFFARGAGADAFKACATKNDPEFGPYLDNTDLGKTLLGFLK